jgi:hypothetical protein
MTLDEAASRYNRLRREFSAARRIDRDCAERELRPALDEARDAYYRAGSEHARQHAATPGLPIAI